MSAASIIQQVRSQGNAVVRAVRHADTAQLLQEQIDAYMIDYRPEGYGTIVERVFKADGQFYAVLARSSSC